MKNQMMIFVIISLILSCSRDSKEINSKTISRADSISKVLSSYYNCSNDTALFATAYRELKRLPSNDNMYIKMHCYRYLAQGYLTLNRDIDSSLYYNTRADSIARILKDTVVLCAINSVYGFAYMNFKADFHKAISYFLICLDYSQKQNHNWNTSISLANLVMAYYNRGDISGLKYAQQLYEANKDKPGSELFVVGAASCAFMYSLKEEYETALEYIELAIHSYDNQIPSTIYALYIEILIKNGLVQKAASVLEDAASKYGEKSFYYEYGELYLEQKKYSAAILCFEKSLSEFNKKNISFHKKTIYQALSNAYLNSGKYREALFYYKEYDKLQDSIFTIDKENIVNDLLVKYEASQKDREIKQKELQLIKEEKKLQIAIFIIVLTIVVISMVYILYQRKNQMYRRLVIQHQDYLMREKINKNIQQRNIASEKEDKGKDVFIKIETMMSDDSLYKKKDLTVESLAELVGSNRSSVSRIINSYSGMTFNNYVNGYRIKRAAELLAETEMPIKVMVDELGFNSASVFYRAFQHSMGVPPTKYRNEVKNLRRSYSKSK